VLTHCIGLCLYDVYQLLNKTTELPMTLYYVYIQLEFRCLSFIYALGV